MINSRRLAAAGLVALAALAPRAARADSRGWILCTPGSLKACHSLQVTTTPVMSAQNVRIGTVVTITVANLQGSSPLDNAPWSGISEISFRGGATPPHSANTAFMSATLNGGATHPAGGAVFQYFDGTGATTNVTIFNATGTGLIGGCSPLPTLLVASFRTCGTGQSVSFSTTVTSIYDAGVFTEAIMQGEGPNGTYRCTSDPTKTTSRPLTLACDDETNPVAVTPEPVTIVLLGSGLFGIGGARLRRKKPTDGA